MKTKKKEEIKPPPITPEVKLHDSYWLAEIAIIILVSAIICILMYPHILTSPKVYHVGDISDRNIKASTDLLVEDVKLTKELREKAVRAVRDVYDFDPTDSHLISRIHEAFKFARENLPENPDQEDVEKLKKGFFEILSIPPDDKIFNSLYMAHFSSEIEQRLISIIEPIIKKGVISDKRLLAQKIRKGIIIHDIISGNEIKVTKLSSFYDKREVKEIILKKKKEIIEETGNKRLAELIGNMAEILIQPNITFNSRETELRKEIAKNSVKPSYFKVKKGEMIVREGEKITPEILLKLNAQRKALKEEKGISKLIGMFVLVCSMLGVTYFIGSLSTGKKSHRRLKDLIFTGLMLLIVYLIVLFSNFIAEEFSRTFQNFSPNALRFIIPVATGSMLVSIFLGINSAIGFSFVASVISAIVLKRHIEYFIYFFVNSLISAYGVKSCRERIVFIKTGLKVGLVNIILAISAEILLGLTSSVEIIIAVISAFMGGIFSGIVTTGLQPLIESVFGYTSDIKLLELASLDQPLLQELMVRAPGTYHHSVIVSNMVEAAAHEIGANPLLAKVAAYYHDIGKMKKPLYFIENQIGTENKHEKLAPSMSALILISHVKDGVEIAKKHKLGQEIIDIIQQHHGTSLITYFYEKAKAQAEKSGKALPNEADFRYPGPKPQTKEAGLVMLADSVEAACRSLSDPTPARIKGTVQNIINKIFADGQLDECELTLKDLNKIAKSFNKTLAGIFHHRIEYPEPVDPKEQKKRLANGTSDQIRKADTRDKEKAFKTEDKNGLRRLGMSG
ncbi:MAG: HD family phosphohydrolase [Deltaproteobacteria bacterium]|nr:MAG: HD family phosphohydrolase [Deltaproteobacteria bacterium]